MRILVTGANRGIGLGLARQLLSRGDTVDATVRDPSTAAQLRALAPATRLRIHACDVADRASVAELAGALGDAALDAVINNAGVWGGQHQTVADLDEAEALRTYEVNALGPLRVVRAVLPHLRRGAGKKVLNITSGMGSIDDNTSGGWYGYRMAKAALNMATRSLAVDLKREQIACAVINPGWVQTDMGGPSAPTTVDDSVRGILAQLDKLSLANTGSFLNWKGGTYAW
jgi:NAD(P)-dependent dehydrogenase (short-subunit alcohol dehydrogenase family)